MFNIGENIKVYLVLRNGYNVQRQRGGDQLRVRIYNKELKAFSAGYVIDHNDGTYTAVTRAIWPGKQTISVTLAYRRETVRAMYYLRQKVSLSFHWQGESTTILVKLGLQCRKPEWVYPICQVGSISPLVKNSK